MMPKVSPTRQSDLISDLDRVIVNCRYYGCYRDVVSKMIKFLSENGVIIALTEEEAIDLWKISNSCKF